MYYDPNGHDGCKEELKQNKQPETPAGQVGDKGGAGSKFQEAFDSGGCCNEFLYR